MPQLITALLKETQRVGWGERSEPQRLRLKGTLKLTCGIRLSPEAEFNGADLSIHKISATAERETSW